LRKQKNDRQRQSRGWNDDSSSLYGNAPDPVSFPSFAASSSAPEVEATVNWYNAEKGFGFVALADGSGDAFLHVSALQASGFQAVAPGSILKVRVGKGQKGRQVDQVLSVAEGQAVVTERRRAPDQLGSRPERPRRQVDLSAAVEMTGTVKWYNPEKGFGFISPDSGGKDVFVHATALERAGLTALNEGQQVRIGVVQGAKGPEAATVSLG
jgi:CspA family cold shock protein